MSCSIVCRPASNTVSIKWNSRVQAALEAHACVIAMQMGSTAKSMRMYSSGFQAQVLVKRTRSACLRLCHADGHLSKPYAFSSTGSRVQGWSSACTHACVFAMQMGSPEKPMRV